MKNELIIAQLRRLLRNAPTERLQQVLDTFGLQGMQERFASPGV